LAETDVSRLAQATAQRHGLDSENSAEIIVQRGGRRSPACKVPWPMGASGLTRRAGAC